MPENTFTEPHQATSAPVPGSPSGIHLNRRSCVHANGEAVGTPTMSPNLHISCTPVSSALQDKPLRARWAELILKNTKALSLYAHPDWVASLDPEQQASTWLCTASDYNAIPFAVLTVSIQRIELPFSVASRALLKPRLDVMVLPGGLPHGAVNDSTLTRMVDHLFATWPACDGLYVSSVAVADTGFTALQTYATHDARAYTYLPWGIRLWHRRRLDQTPDTYFSALPKKQRSNIRRALRDMRKSGEPELLICRDPQDVPRFVSLAARVSQRSWHARVLGIRIGDDDTTRRRFQAQAAAGLLRSYVLCHAGEPLAYVLGHQDPTYYQFAQIGHDNGQGAFSPGIVLLHKVIEDLLSSDTPTWLNFGIGDAAYKHRFGNTIDNDAAVLLLRRRVHLQLLTHAHYSFNALIEQLKRHIGRRVS